MKTERKRFSRRLLSVVLAFCLMLSVVAPLTVFADETTGNPWVQDESTVQGGETNELTDDGWIHLASGASNGNSTSGTSLPAIFINQDVAFGDEGYISFTMKTVDSSTDRFGIYLGYQDPGHGLFLGYDSGGWFWQKYDGVNDSYYSGTRVAVPTNDVETPVEIQWANNTVTLTVSGTVVFDALDYSDLTDLTETIAIKCGSYSSSEAEVTDIYITAFEELVTAPDKFAVSGVVTDGDGQPVSGASVRLNSQSASTGEDGSYSLSDLLPGDYTATVSKSGYETAVVDFTVTDADVVLNVTINIIPPVVYGDVNLDAAINSVDATLVLQNYAEIEVTDTFNETNADVNGDEKIDSADATLILQYYADIITQFPVETVEPNPPIDDDDSAIVLTSAAGSNGIYMDVQVDPDYPRVNKYTMHGTADIEGKEMAGQSDELSTVIVNGVSFTPEITSVVSDDNSSITYTIPLQSEENNIDCVLTTVIKVEGDTLELRITDIQNNLVRETYPVKTISFPNQSLVSVWDTQNDANLMASIVSSYTYIAGDEYVDFSAGETPSKTAYNYAVISNNELSASVESNSMYDKSGSGIGYGGMTDGDNVRIAVTVQNKGEYKSLGLSSSEWVYDSVLNSYDGRSTPTYIEYYDEDDMPYVKVAIAGDENSDGQIDWNDGAIAFRDISHYIPGSETVPEHVTYRIAMNFGGQAQNPFLTTLDNVKKVALNTEGLGQSILLKGYGSEGHDSGHPDYADIGERIGGVDDMLTLLQDGKNYGATFGIHVNASEMYPEAQAFSDEMVKRSTSGDLSYGWNWLDQGIGINGVYDLASGSRLQRFQELYDEVGNNLDFVYLDVWGNGTSGNEDTVTTRNVGNQITSFGWRMGNEWGTGTDWYATMQHWASDLAYGDSSSKGFNSVLMRFIRNSQKDSWVADCPDYGGAANAPLLGGMEMYDFEGWQGRTDYDLYINILYSHNVTTKFIQHYEVTKWVNSENSYTVNGYEWTPEMYIELTDEDGNLVTLTRGSDDVNSSAYRDRTITYNGVVISTGACTTGKSRITGTEAYLIPWFWDSEGNLLSDDEMKLYHWNCLGGETTWTLVDEWQDCSTVFVYELTDTGKINETEVKVVDGQITINADAETPYVVYKGETAQMDIEWSTGTHLTDVGFNSGSLDVWNVTDGASIVKTGSNNPMLALTGSASAHQQFKDLTPGQTYAVYVGVDNRSDGNATITITDSEGGVLDSNYTASSIARNYIKAYGHNNNSATVSGTYGSYFQNMYVYFTAPADGVATVTLSLEGASGTSAAYFDDIRIVETEFDGLVKDEDGALVSFTNDFENNAQGVYPFVIGSIEGVEDNRTHLSQLHDPYTQAGWDVKKLDDVIGGEWSVKANGLDGASAIVMQTIPQNLRFEPGVTYTVAFDYEMGSEGTYQVIIGDGTSTSYQTVSLQKTLGDDTTGITTSEEDGYVNNATVKRAVFTITGSESGQSWFGIYSTNASSDTQGTSGSAASFGGYYDFVLDNLTVVQSNVDWSKLNENITAASAFDSRDYTEETYLAMQSALTAAQAVLNNINSTQDEVDTAANALAQAIEGLSRISATLTGKVVNEEGEGIENALVTLKTSGESNLTARTGSDGSYTFADIPIRDYTIMVSSATGYSSKYNIAVGTLAQGENTMANIVLSVKTGDYDYTNEFDDADMITGVEPLTGNTGTVSINYSDGSLYVGFPGGGRNNVVFTDAGTFVNATVEFDLTPASSSSARFGISFRATDLNNRVWVGINDTNGYYFWEIFGGDNTWSDNSSGPALQQGTTYHIVATLNDRDISISVDGTTILSETISSSYDMVTDDGYIGVECRSAEGFYIDNVKITDLGV